MPDPDLWLWPAPEKAAAGDAAADDSEALARAFARCLRGDDGERVLHHLRAVTIERRLPPDAGEALLRHLEGQRHLTAHICALVARGRGAAASPPDPSATD